MPREQIITVTRGTVRRDYLVVYRDDPPARAEAVLFFQGLADCDLFPCMELPPEVDEMPIEEANTYLRQHPIQEQWSLLTIGRQSSIRDDDLARLRYLPEISHVKISSDQITDAGVKHLLLLGGLSRLLIYSNQVTDRCLGDIQTMRSLLSLDIQAAPKISRKAALALVDAMPWLQDAWPPPDPHRLAESQRRSRLSRGAQSEIPGLGNQTYPEVREPPLRFVDFSWRPLAQPPAEIFEKDDIERLDMIGCGLEVLPKAIGNLTRLRTLYANRGRLTELPSEIGLLTALEHLWLNDNQLTDLPDSFRRLLRLQTLSLDDNYLQHFPTPILDLKQLEALRMTGNKISALPEGVGDLKELRSLSLGRNNLATLPRTICCLEKLTYLGLQWNPVRQLPDEVWQLPCLITLNLTHSGLTKLPPEAAKIPNILGLPGRRVRS